MQAADSKRAEDIVALDVREVSLLADYFMICSANSERQLNAITEEIIEKEEENRSPLGSESCRRETNF